MVHYTWSKDLASEPFKDVNLAMAEALRNFFGFSSSRSSSSRDLFKAEDISVIALVVLVEVLRDMLMKWEERSEKVILI